MRTVHVRINDAAGEPTPVRLRVTGPAGEYHAPLGQAAEFPVGRAEDVGGGVLAGGERWAVVPGVCEVPLPAGVPLRVRALKGPEFAPLDGAVTLGPGQMALRFAVHRVHDWRAAGWHPGDGRAHFLSADAAHLEARAEDLAVVQLLALDHAMPSFDGRTYQTFPQLAAFSGQAAARTGGGATVAVNTLNAHPALGRVALWHAHRPVFPLAFGPPDAADDWSVAAWCQQARRKGGVAVWADPFRPAHGGEALVALVNGEIDAVEADPRPRKVPFRPAWYRLLTAGVRAPVVGASGKDSNRTPLGAVRTFAHVPAGEPVTLAAWAAAVAAGRTVATTGPLVTVTVAGAGPGATLPAGRHPARAAAWSLAPFDRVEVVLNGAVVAAAAAARAGGHFAAEVECELTADTAGWAAGRVTGPGFAHTSAVTFAGDPAPGRAAARAGLAALVRQSRDWVETVAVTPDPAGRARLLATWDAALAALEGP